MRLDFLAVVGMLALPEAALAQLPDRLAPPDTSQDQGGKPNLFRTPGKGSTPSPGEDLTVGPGPARCDPNRLLEQVLDAGATVELDDGSKWNVNEFDRSITQNWQQDAPITACRDELINREEHDIARAQRTAEGHLTDPE